MVQNMWHTLHPVDGAQLATVLSAAGLGPPRTFFRALGYRASVSLRASGPA